MTKIFSHKALMAAAATLAVALPGTAQAGGHRHDDCLHKVFRDLDRGMTRVVHHADRTLTHMFRWCDRRHRK